MNYSYSIGDRVFVKDYGVGTITKIDEKSRDFTYFVRFKGHARGWFPKHRLSEYVEPVAKVESSDEKTPAIVNPFTAID